MVERETKSVAEGYEEEEREGSGRSSSHNAAGRKQKKWTARVSSEIMDGRSRGTVDSLSDEDDEERSKELGEWLSKVVSKQESSASEARALDPMLPPSRLQQRLMFFAHLELIWKRRRRKSEGVR